MTLTDLKQNWLDEPNYHKQIHESFIELVNADDKLKAHRDFVEQNAFGFGERSFWWMWKLLLNELPEDAKLAEIGVFRGATLSVWKLLKPNAAVYGISPLDSSDGHWESDYVADVKQIHNDFGLDQPIIYRGLSTDADIINKAANTAPYDVVYIDGSHQYADVVSDFANYPQMVKSGGYLVVDDCNNEMSMPFGFFQGIADVTRAKLEWLQTYPDFEFIFSVVHISIFRRK